MLLGLLYGIGVAGRFEDAMKKKYGKKENETRSCNSSSRDRHYEFDNEDDIVVTVEGHAKISIKEWENGDREIVIVQ